MSNVITLNSLKNSKEEEMLETNHKQMSFDMVDFIIRYEDNDMSASEMIEGFQHMINTGMVWVLQGHYGRTAAALIDLGLCTPAGR
jgi:hypothetical protein